MNTEPEILHPRLFEGRIDDVRILVPARDERSARRRIRYLLNYVSPASVVLAEVPVETKYQRPENPDVNT